MKFTHQVLTDLVDAQQNFEQLTPIIRQPLGWINPRDHGAQGNGSSDDTPAVAQAATVAGPLGTVFFPPGTYSVNPFTCACSLIGAGPNASKIVRRDTAGGDFIHSTGSHLTVQGLTIDGKRANQPQGTAGGSLAFYKPNGTCPTGTFAGAMTLTADVAANATSLTVASATFGSITVQPGDMLSLLDGSKFEYVQVADSYTPGATTIPLYEAVTQAYAHATCNVVCCPTGINVLNSTIYGGQRDAVYFWSGHGCKAIGNRIYDTADTGLDLPAGGTANIFAHNVIRTNGRYGIAVDTTSSTTFIPVASRNAIVGNRIAIRSGGSDPGGQMLYGIVALVSSHTDVIGNLVDISTAGVDAIRMQGHTYANVLGNRVIGPGSSGSGASATSTIGIHDPTGGDTRSRVEGNTIRGTDRGIQLEKVRHAVVSDNEIYNVSNYGIDFEVDTGNVQTFVVTGNQIDGCVAGIRGGGTGGTSTIKTGLNNIFNASFAAITSDAGWTVSSIAGFA